MNPRKSLILRQHFAHASSRVKSAFASDLGLSHSVEVGEHVVFVSALTCDPFPMTWPSPFGVGSFFAHRSRKPFHRHNRADCGVHSIFSFVSGKIALESVSITTKHRGKTSCRKPSLFFYWSQPRLRAVCKTRLHGALQAPLPVWRLLTIKTATCWAARLSAASQALRLARCLAKSAAKTQASDLFDLTAPAAGHFRTSTTQGAFPFGWFFHFARPAACSI